MHQTALGEMTAALVKRGCWPTHSTRQCLLFVAILQRFDRFGVHDEVRMLAPLILLLQTLSPPPALSGWPTIAEAWTAPNENSTIDAGYRMFTAPELGDICRRAPSPARLVAHGPVILRVGQWFNFSSLRIVALDAGGHRLAPVPVRLEVEEVYPPLFSMSNDIIGYGGVTPTRAGRFRFRARTICLGTSAELFVPAVVRKR